MIDRWLFEHVATKYDLNPDQERMLRKAIEEYLSTKEGAQERFNDLEPVSKLQYKYLTSTK